MLILDVGKVRYNKKFYKTIIYTMIVVNIISFGIFPRSQSKYKEEESNAVKYATSLYLEKEYEEEFKEDTLIFEDIKLIDNNYKYQSTSSSAYFTYSILSNDYELNYQNINNNITFNWETDIYVNGYIKFDGNCKVIEYQTSKDNRGILLCEFSNLDTSYQSYFEEYGISLTIEAKDTITRYTETKKEIIDLSIYGNVRYTGKQYEDSVKEIVDENPYVLVLDNQYDCLTFRDWLIKYDHDYYSANAAQSYLEDAGSALDQSTFSALKAIFDYVSKYVDLESSTCSLFNLDIPGINYEEASYQIDGSDSSVLRFIFTIEDNFVGYAKTYTQDDGLKTMYFSTSDGRSFRKETDVEKWQSIFTEYLEYFYPKDKVKEIKDYIINVNENGILYLLQRIDVNNTGDIPGIRHYLHNNQIEIIAQFIYDKNYNISHKDEKKVRVSILGTSDSDVLRMFEIYKIGLINVFEGDSYPSFETLQSISNIKYGIYTNSEKYLEIFDIITSAELGSKDYFVSGIVGCGELDKNKTYTVHIYSDGTYNWFEFLPEGKNSDANTVEYTFNPTANSGLKDILAKVQMLDGYYKVNKHITLNEGIRYMYNSGTVVGYVKVSFVYDEYKNIQEVVYKAYIGEFDQQLYPETEDVVSPDESPSVDSDLTENSELASANPSVDSKKDDTELVKQEKHENNDNNALDDFDETENKQTDIEANSNTKDTDIPLTQDGTVHTNTASNNSIDDLGCESIPNISIENEVENISEVLIVISHSLT